jgi:hypothetical protein
MTEKQPPAKDTTANDAHLAMRKAHREAMTHASRLAERLDEVDIHQREARYLLERAGLLARRGRAQRIPR